MWSREGQPQYLPSPEIILIFLRLVTCTISLVIKLLSLWGLGGWKGAVGRDIPSPAFKLMNYFRGYMMQKHHTFFFFFFGQGRTAMSMLKEGRRIQTIVIDEM